MTSLQVKKSLSDLDPSLQSILESYINPFVYAETQNQKEEIYDKASTQTNLSKKEVYAILSHERSKIQAKHVNEMAELSMSDNEAFICKYSIREKIPQDQLPCVFGINMFGNVQYTHKTLSDIPNSNKDLQFYSKINKEYVCSGWGRKTR